MKFHWNSNKYTTISDLQEKVGNELIEQLNLNETDQVLDAGCVIGNISFKVAGIVKRGHVLGIDSSSSMIEKCYENLKTINSSNVKFITKSITEIDFTNEFNVVFSNSVFHWLKETGKALGLLYGSLKPGGSIGIQFPLLNSQHPLVTICEKVITKLKLETEFQNWDFPWYVPTLNSFKYLMRKYDFEKFNVYQKTTEYDFHESINVYNFFDSVGLNLYTSKLSKEKEKIFKPEIYNEIEKLKDLNKLKIHFERLYAFGYNKLTN